MIPFGIVFGTLWIISGFIAIYCGVYYNSSNCDIKLTFNIIPILLYIFGFSNILYGVFLYYLNRTYFQIQKKKNIQSHNINIDNNIISNNTYKYKQDVIFNNKYGGIPSIIKHNYIKNDRMINISSPPDTLSSSPLWQSSVDYALI